MNPNRGKARIGVLVPFTNTNLEPDMALLAPPGVSVHIARLGGYDVDKIPDAVQMAGLGSSDINEPLRLLSGVRPDVILYGCTSATLSLGTTFDRDLAVQVERASGAKTVTAAGALVAALSALSVRQIAFASPYVASMNDLAISFLSDCGIKTVSRADYPNDLGNYGQGELTPDDVFALGCRANSPNAEALVLSCTDMRSVETIDRLEQELGKPVITSNQAMMYCALRHLGIAPPSGPLGLLMKEAIPA